MKSLYGGGTNKIYEIKDCLINLKIIQLWNNAQNNKFW